MRRSWVGSLAFGAITAGLLVAAAGVMFSAFMYYDDEGYVLQSLRNFAEHGRLYRDVYTQYGPFPFVCYALLQGIGVTLTHTVGRLLTLTAWAGTALACAALVGQATRSLLARVAVLVGVFVYLWIMANEPTHPGGLIGFITALMAWLGYRWIVNDRIGAFAVLVGVGGTALLLTKINVGVFALFSAGCWWLLHHQHPTIRRWSPLVAGGLAAVLPFGLMRSLLAASWVQTYALITSLALVATVLAASIGRGGRTGGRDALRLVLASAAIGVTVIAFVLLRGSTGRDLIDGVLLGPLRHPVTFSLEFHWPPLIRFGAIASLLGGVAALILRRRWSSGVDATIALARLFAAAAIAGNLAGFPAVSPDRAVFGATLPLVWLFVWPLEGEDRRRGHARAWLALLMLGQALHAFPVPGSQIAWGTFLLLPLAAVGAWEAVAWLRAHGTMTALFRTRALPVALGALVAAFAVLLGVRFARVGARYQDGQYLGLPGAELIRVPTHSAAQLRVLAYNAAAHADVLFSFPGMFSFNVWTGRPTPTLANVTHWFSLIDDARQQEIIRALESHPNACVLIDRGHLRFLAQHGIVPRGPLVAYLADKFEPAFRADDIEFAVHRGRHIEPYLLGELLTRAEGAEGGAAENSLLRFTMLVPPRTPIATIELVPDRPNATTAIFSGKNARTEVLAPHRAGRGETAVWPLRLTEPSRIALFFDRSRVPASTGPATLVLRNERGEEIGLGRLAF